MKPKFNKGWAGVVGTSRERLAFYAIALGIVGLIMVVGPLVGGYRQADSELIGAGYLGALVWFTLAVMIIVCELRMRHDDKRDFGEY
jgi:hypothetical protein